MSPEPSASPGNVSRWHASWRSGGLDALRSAGPTGQPPRLSGQQLHAIDQALREGARARVRHRYWTLARVTSVIERPTGVACHPGARTCRREIPGRDR